MCKERSDKNVSNFRPGHILENPVNSITEKFLFFFFNPTGQKEQRRPKNMQRREIQTEINSMKKTWRELQQTATDRQAWQQLRDYIPWGVKRHKKNCHKIIKNYLTNVFLKADVAISIFINVFKSFLKERKKYKSFHIQPITNSNYVNK